MEPAPPKPRRPLARWAAITVGLAVVVLAVLGGIAWVADNLTAAIRWRLALSALIAARVTYLAIGMIMLVATPLLIVAAIRTRRQGRRRPLLARGALLGVSILLALAVAEVGAAAWLAMGRASVLEASLRSRPKPSRGPDSAATLPDPSPGVPLPISFSDPADDPTIDVVVIGGSSAEGVPLNLASLSPGSLVAWKLGEALPDRPIRFLNLAASGNTLEAQERRLGSIENRPDLLIIYSGHNEFSARMSWDREPPHYLDASEPSGVDRLFRRVEEVSPLCRLIARAIETCRISIPPPPGGNRALVDVPVYTPAEYVALRDDFARRLDRIVAWSDRLGALPVLVVPAANDAELDPNRSFLPPDTPRAERDEVARQMEHARDLGSPQPDQAIAAYRSILDRFPGFAEAHFRLARLLRKAGEDEAAYPHFVAARDLDGLPMRCPSDFQQVYRDVAARHDCVLLDSQAYLHAIGEGGQLDDHLFLDMMHPSLRGQIALAQGVLAGIHGRGAFGLNGDGPTIDPAEVIARFGLTPGAWREMSFWGMMVHELLAPAAHDPTLRKARYKAFQSAALGIEAGQPPETVDLPNVGQPPPVPRSTVGVVPSTKSGGD